MIFGRTIDGEEAIPRHDEQEPGVVKLLLDLDGMNLNPLQFDPQEARDLAKGLVWAAERAESALARIAHEEDPDGERR